MKLEFTGLKKEGETAFAEQTKIARWFPGDVREVSATVASKLLEHPSMWRVTDLPLTYPDPTSSASLASAKPVQSPGVPAWVKPLMDKGLTDEQLEAVAQAGGPETPAGKALVDAALNTSVGEFVVTIKDKTIVLDNLERNALWDLANDNGLKPHNRLGEEKLRQALLDAFPAAKQ